MRFLRECLLDVRRSWTRSLLTSLSLALAVLAVVAIYVTGSVARQVLVATAEQRYGRAPTVAVTFPAGTIGVSDLSADLAVAGRLLTTQGIDWSLTAPGGALAAVAAPGSPGPSPGLTLVSGSLQTVRRLPTLSGVWLAPDGVTTPGGVLVNEAAAGQVGGVGSEVTIVPDPSEPGVPERVVGVIADGTSQPEVYASLTSVLRFRPAALSGQDLTLSVHDPARPAGQLVDDATRVALAMGAEPSQLGPTEVDQVAQAAGEIVALRRAFLLVAAVSLVVAAAGLVNIGLAGVASRSRELTVRRAVGATRARVFGLVLTTSLAPGLLAGAVAVAVGLFGVTFAEPHFLTRSLGLVPTGFPWSASVVGFALGILASAAGGVIPAVRAAGVDLAGSLRE